jgi:tetratricopeptide (TPR) repeat protein
MITKKGPVSWSLLFLIALSISAFGQGRRNQQQQQQQVQTQPPQQVLSPRAQTKDESDAFNALQKEQAPDKRIELADAFVAKFPNSDLMQYVQGVRVDSYSKLGKFKEAIGASEEAINALIKYGEKIQARADSDSKLSDKDKEAARKKDKNAVFVDKESAEYKTFMSQSEDQIFGLHQFVMNAYQQLNDAPKMVEWGEKALGFKPNDVMTLTMLSNVMAERPPASEAEKTVKMKRAEELANQALEALPAFLASPDGSKLNATAKADLTAQMHYTLGLIYLHQKRLSSSEQELLTSIKSKSNDPITYYRLGIAYVQDMKNDLGMEALGKSVFLKGVSEAGAREILKQLWVNKNKSEQGMEDYIKASGSKIGQ